MNRTIVFFIGWLLICHTAFTQTPSYTPIDLHWQLKWEEHFNTFNTARWLKAEYSDHYYKDEQLYRAKNVWVQNGNLVIEINNIKDTCPNPHPPEVPAACGPCTAGKKYNYTSGWVATTPAYNTQFGYIEARIKLPFVRKNNKSWGFWPAFWTFIGADVPPPTNVAEIDIFEMFCGNYKKPNKFFTCLYTCYLAQNPNCEDDFGITLEFSDFDFTDWHTYAIEWNANRIIWYLDGKVIRSQNDHGIVNPVRIILNLALQSYSGFLPPTSPAFQEYMYVDYVKVYQLKCDKTTVVNEISNFNTYNYAVKKSITMSNATTIPSGSNITLRATDFIELKSGFEVQTGRELYLDITPCDGPNNCLDYLTDQTITSNTTVTGCDMLLVQDVEISNSAQVVITAGEEMSIKPGFHAAAGTNVKIGIVP